jgi:phosphoribosylanthranilate isomerase
MGNLRVKICGITRPDQAQAIARLGATDLGFICVESSPRFVTPEQIGTIAAALAAEPETSSEVQRIGVFVNAPFSVIARTIQVGRLSGVQLHGEESPEFCQQLQQQFPRIEQIKALRIRSLEALSQAEIYASIVDTLLLDAYHPQLAGGTGQTLDWPSLRRFQPQCPWLLAGGLTPDNVLTALAQLHPQGIDLSSGVERAPGDKDLAKVALLFQRLRAGSIPLTMG